MNEEKTDKGRPHAATGASAPPGRPEATHGGRSASGARPAPPGRKGEDGGKGTPRPRGGSALAAVALVVSLLVAGGAAGGGYWLWQQDQRLQAQQSQYLAAGSLQGHLQPLQDRLATLSGELQQLTQRSAGPSDQALASLDKRVNGLRQGQSQAQQQLANLQQINAELRQSTQKLKQRFDDLARAKQGAWAESEAGYLAFVAENRIRFYGDVDSALAALKKADRLLASLGGEAIDARRGIARAVDSLLEVKPPDRLKLDQALGQLVDRLDSLPLAVGPRNEQGASAAPAASAASDSSANWSTQLGHAWNELRGSLASLVVVSRDRKVVPLVTPQERFFLHQNLTLELEAARFAALRGNQTLYQESLSRVHDWLGVYFDKQSAAVTDTMHELSELAAKPVSVPLPDISSMLGPVKQLGLRSAQ